MQQSYKKEKQEINKTNNFNWSLIKKQKHSFIEETQKLLFTSLGHHLSAHRNRRHPANRFRKFKEIYKKMGLT